MMAEMKLSFFFGNNFNLHGCAGVAATGGTDIFPVICASVESFSTSADIRETFSCLLDFGSRRSLNLFLRKLHTMHIRTRDAHMCWRWWWIHHVYNVSSSVLNSASGAALCSASAWSLFRCLRVSPVVTLLAMAMTRSEVSVGLPFSPPVRRPASPLLRVVFQFGSGKVTSRVRLQPPTTNDSRCDARGWRSVQPGRIDSVRPVDRLVFWRRSFRWDGCHDYELGCPILVRCQEHIGEIVRPAFHLDSDVTLTSRFCPPDRQTGNLIPLCCDECRMIHLPVCLILGVHATSRPFLLQLLHKAQDLVALSPPDKKDNNVRRSLSETRHGRKQLLAMSVSSEAIAPRTMLAAGSARAPALAKPCS